MIECYTQRQPRPLLQRAWQSPPTPSPHTHTQLLPPPLLAAADSDGAHSKKKGVAGQFIVDVLVNCVMTSSSGSSSAEAGPIAGATARGSAVRLLPPGDKAGTPLVVTFPLSQVRQHAGKGLPACLPGTRSVFAPMCPVPK